MKSGLISLGIVCLLVNGGLIGVLNFLSVEVQSTSVSGTIYDGSGGPWVIKGSPYIVVEDVYIPAGHTLTIEPGVEVKFDGYYSINVHGMLIAIGTPGDVIVISSNSPSPEPGDWDKIYLSDTGRAFIEYCEISYSYIGICLDSSSYNDISYNNFFENHDFGIYIDNSSANEIISNNFDDRGIGIHGYLKENWNTHNIDSANNLNGKPIYYWKDQIGGTIPPGAGQVILANSTNVIIEEQDLIYNTVGIALGFSSDNHIANNNISTDYKDKIGGNSSSNPNSSEEFRVIDFTGIYLSNSYMNTIINNYIYNNEVAINVEQSQSNEITENIIYNNIWGINIGFSSKDVILNNDVSTNRTMDHQWGYGIHTFRSNWTTISNNRVSKSGKCIYIQNSNNITVTQNNLSQNKGEGVRCWVSENVVITHNDIWANGLGIRMFQFSYLMLVHHNNIIDNDLQGIDGASNKWDDGYPSGGNHWSDYNGIDVFKGPNQDIPGSDGIGDTPYIIDGDSQDYYPLMDPAGHDQESYDLCKGWNFISTPLIQSNTYVDYVLSSISGSYDIVQWYDSDDESDHWKLDHISKPASFNDLNNIDHTMGVWVHITEPEGVTFENYGSIPTVNQDIQIYPGWNLVGYPSMTNFDRTSALNNIIFGEHVDSIWTYNAETNTWVEVGESDLMIAGNAYWVHSLAEVIWEVPFE